MKEYGLKKYEDSGLREWHESVVNDTVKIYEQEIDQLHLLYEEEFQVIGVPKS
ncbi:MAG: hypothetical protein KDD40_01690 [Bdellovibrionales bacterium]|nr:hypothetical protein [Bdellovibrionales bacterium]